MASVYDGLPATAKPLKCCRLTSGLNPRQIPGILSEGTTRHQQAVLTERTPSGGESLFSRTNQLVGNTGFEPVTSTV